MGGNALQVGQSADFSKMVTEADVVRFAEITGDRNPVHLDAAYGERSPFGGRIAHGMLTASFISTVLAMRLPGPGTGALGRRRDRPRPDPPRRIQGAAVGGAPGGDTTTRLGEAGPPGSGGGGFVSADGGARQAKGSTLLSTVDFIAAEAGAAAAERTLALLPERSRRALRRISPTDEIPLERLLELWRAADEVLAGDVPDWIERSGGHAIDSMGVQGYRGILLKASPTEFLTQRVSLFKLYYQPGSMEVVEEEAGRAVLRLVGFDPGDPLFCRRQTGGLLRSVELAGGHSAQVAHVRCALEGDAFCEWELRWG